MLAMPQGFSGYRAPIVLLLLSVTLGFIVVIAIYFYFVVHQQKITVRQVHCRCVRIPGGVTWHP